MPNKAPFRLCVMTSEERGDAEGVQEFAERHASVDQALGFYCGWGSVQYDGMQTPYFG